MSAMAKPFQQATVEAACEALWGGNPLRRFLVADEVGLGKTVVARDIVEALSAKARKFTVYYVTSGQKVADQNKTELLRFLKKDDIGKSLSTVDRIGLIPFERKSDTQLRLYAFTPTTSFSGGQKLYGGKAVERAFISQLIEEIYPDLIGSFPKGYLEHGATTGWPWALTEARRQMNHVSDRFVVAYGKALRAEFGLPARQAILAAVIADPPGRVIGRMRKALAQAALHAAPPDLVIFDEFQCYKDLLDPKHPNPLASQLLAGPDGVGPPLLLLSATPYRFYAERWETGNGIQPHNELFEIIEFLGGNKVRVEAESNFRRFGNLLHQIGRLDASARPAAIAEARTIKCRLEGILTPIMSRTERPVVTHHDRETPSRPVLIEPHDLDVYKHFTSNVTGRLRTSAIYYWLSVPLPAQALGDRYQISRDVDFPVTKGVPRLSAANCYRNPKDAWGNAKLRALSSLVPTDALALPWVLPSLSWWKPGGAWTKVDRCPKMLIFSRFKATPQSVAALLSLDVERRFIGKDSTSYSAAWKKKHLNPKPNQGPTLALFHPSPFLIMNVDPLDARNGATIKHVRQRVRQQIIKALPSSINPAAPNARGEKRSKPTWQVLAAIEQAKDGEMTKLFANVQATWRKVAGKVDATLSALIDQRQSPEPISWISSRELDALVEMALGAPGVVAGRALFRHLPNLFSFNEDHYLRLLRFCWTQLRTYLDRPVFWSVLDGMDATEKLQRASIDGCLEAVLDEHFWLRKSKVNSDGLIEDLAKALAVNVGNFGFRGTKKSDRVRIRCHVAVPFGGTESEKQRQGVLSEEAAPARSEEIREAFNTPFWPFVLATTSVGQEGLDFHSWCDSLGHWDLCSNPVDLEQREGRIQRYGGLSVRQPLARELGVAALTEARGRKSSPWQIIADRADKDYGDASGMSPWWTMPGAEIKRHLFALPQSRDIDRFARLRSQRLLYRLALGQPDQEDLVELLTNHDAETGAALADLTLNLSAISHRKVSTTAPHPPAASQASRVPARVSG